MALLRFYRERPITPPAREASDYSTEEQQRLQQSFARLAARCRLQQFISALTILGAILWMILMATLLTTSSPPWAAASIAIGWLIPIVILSTGPRLVCPGCGNDLELADRRLGPYCPECGRRELQPSDWLHGAMCKACGRAMYRGPKSGRHYKIRCCTHCG